MTELSLCPPAPSSAVRATEKESGCGDLGGPAVRGRRGDRGERACSALGVRLSPVHVGRGRRRPEAGRPREPGCGYGLGRTRAAGS